MDGGHPIKDVNWASPRFCVSFRSAYLTPPFYSTAALHGGGIFCSCRIISLKTYHSQSIFAGIIPFLLLSMWLLLTVLQHLSNINKSISVLIINLFTGTKQKIALPAPLNSSVRWLWFVKMALLWFCGTLSTNDNGFFLGKNIQLMENILLLYTVYCILSILLPFVYLAMLFPFPSS